MFYMIKYVTDFTMAYLQKHGFEKPVLIKDKAEGLIVPSKIFSVNDVKICVGKSLFYLTVLKMLYHCLTYCMFLVWK